MIHPSDFGSLRAFVMVAEKRSFTRAAEALGLSSSALSQTIRSLEDRLGTRLLNRTTRSVSLTEAGTRLLDEARPALASLGEAFDHARRPGGRPRGTVRLHCFHAAADLFVAPVLPAFAREFPDIVLDLTVDDTVVDVVAEGYDAAIRIGEVIARDMVALRLGGEIRQIAAASPAYLAEHGTPETPHDLFRHRCIRWRWPGQSTPYAWEFFDGERWFAVAVDGPLIANSRAFTLQAALDGVGITFVKEDAVLPFIAEGRLVALLDRWSAPFPGFFLCTPQQRHLAPAVRALIDAIVAPYRAPVLHTTKTGAGPSRSAAVSPRASRHRS